MLDFIIIAALFLCAAVFLVPAALVIFGAVKRRKKLAITCAAVLAAEILLVGSYSVLFPTCFPFVDLWVQGKTKSEIASCYGESDLETERRLGYIVGKDNGFFGVMSSNLDEYYYIIFDENGTAVSVEKGGSLGG